ncbi:hypothetical protein GCM10027187_49540 [Streptosporangium sandarakinum]
MLPATPISTRPRPVTEQTSHAWRSRAAYSGEPGVSRGSGTSCWSGAFGASCWSGAPGVSCGPGGPGTSGGLCGPGGFGAFGAARVPGRGSWGAETMPPSVTYGTPLARPRPGRFAGGPHPADSDAEL